MQAKEKTMIVRGGAGQGALWPAARRAGAGARGRPRRAGGGRRASVECLSRPGPRGPRRVRWTRPCGAGGRGCAGRAPGPGPRCPRTRPRAPALRAAPARAPSPAGTSARAGAKKGTRHSMRAQTRARAHTHTHTRSETAKRGVDGYVLAGFGTTEGPEVPRGRPPARPPPPLLLPRCLAFLTRSHAHARTHTFPLALHLSVSLSPRTHISLFP